MFRRRRFGELIARQLDVFAADEAGGLLAEVREMKERYDGADRDEAEEAYGDYGDVVEAATEALADMRDRFKRTLDDAAADEYEAEFNRAVKKRWPPFGLEIDLR
jgi:hypothetical protein